MNLSTMIEYESDRDIPRAITLGADLSANRQVDVRLAKQLNYGVTFMWPATPVDGTNPTGAFWIAENNTDSEDGWAVIEEFALAEIIAKQPAGAGTASGYTVKNIKTTSPFIRIGYTATTGGVKVVPQVFIFAK